MILTTLLPLLLLQISSVFAKKFNGCLTIEQCPELAKIETEECQPYHIFLARGSTSPYPGHLSDLVKMVCSKLDDSEDQKNCGFENINYPAKNGKGEWGNSAHEGAVNGQAQMRNYTERCPDSKMIVFGFSQGGSVVLDLIGGGGGSNVFNSDQPPNEPLGRTTAAGKNVAAIIAFGPTVRTRGQNFTIHGGDKWDGMTPRSEESLNELYKYDGLLREYCQPRDPICSPKSGSPETGKTTMDRHLDYFEKWNGEAANWVVDVVRKGTEASPAEEGSGSGTDTTEPQASSSRIADLVSSGSSLSMTKVLGIGMVLLAL